MNITNLLSKINEIDELHTLNDVEQIVNEMAEANWSIYYTDQRAEAYRSINFYNVIMQATKASDYTFRQSIARRFTKIEMLKNVRSSRTKYI